MMKRFLAMALLVALPMTAIIAQTPEAALSQGREEEEYMSNFEYYSWETISSVIPILVLFIFLFFLIRKSMQRNQPYVQRSQQHMDRMEEKYDRIIQLLEELIKKRE